MDSAIYLCHKVEDLSWGGGVLGNMWHCLGHFYYHNWGAGATGLQLVEARDVTWHPATHRETSLPYTPGKNGKKC